MAQQDARIDLLQQTNQGVAAARNLGILAGRAELIALTDADDIWHPTKIEKQLALFEQEGPALSFVYCGRRHIDENSRVEYSPPLPISQGRVYLQHLYSNFINNGSAIMALRSALIEIGGYFSDLREAGAEGCEDFLVQAHLAARFEGALVPEYLVGYRQGPGRMSSDKTRMERSQIVAMEMVRRELGDLPMLTRWNRAAAHFEEAVGSLKGILPLRFIVKLTSEFALDPKASSHWMLNGMRRWNRRLLRRSLAPQDPAVGRPFLEVDPAQLVEPPSRLYRGRIEMLAQLDRDFQPRVSARPPLQRAQRLTEVIVERTEDNRTGRDGRIAF
jgi:glycosyltransferase involved in cell wall biosynthesis